MNPRPERTCFPVTPWWTPRKPLAFRPQDVGLTGEVWAAIEVTTKSKPLIRALAGSALGSFDALTGTYVVSGSDLVEGLPEHVPSHMGVVNAFVAPLRAQGFVVGVRTVPSSGSG